MNPGYLNFYPTAGKIGDVTYNVVGKPANQSIICETTVRGLKYVCIRPVSDIKNWFKGKTITEKCHKLQFFRKDGIAIQVPTLEKKNNKYADIFKPLIQLTDLINERIMRVMETNLYSTVVKKDGEEVRLRSLYTSKKPRSSIIASSQKSQKYPLLEKILSMLSDPKYSKNEKAQQLLEQLKVYESYMARNIEVFDKDGKELDVCSQMSLSMQSLKKILSQLQSQPTREQVQQLWELFKKILEKLAKN